MKIRIKGNSIRYRLTKTEVETFCKTGSYKETTNFGNSVFTYQLKAKKELMYLRLLLRKTPLHYTLPIRNGLDGRHRIGLVSVVPWTYPMESNFPC